MARVVAETDHVALMPGTLAKRLASRMGLVIHRSPVEVEAAALVMAWHRRATQAPASRWLCAEIRRILSGSAVGSAPDKLV